MDDYLERGTGAPREPGQGGEVRATPGLRGPPSGVTSTSQVCRDYDQICEYFDFDDEDRSA
jgi:hypothetical protein